MYKNSIYKNRCYKNHELANHKIKIKGIKNVNDNSNSYDLKTSV